VCAQACLGAQFQPPAVPREQVAAGITNAAEDKDVLTHTEHVGCPCIINVASEQYQEIAGALALKGLPSGYGLAGCRWGTEGRRESFPVLSSNVHGRACWNTRARWPALERTCARPHAHSRTLARTRRSHWHSHVRTGATISMMNVRGARTRSPPVARCIHDGKNPASPRFYDCSPPNRAPPFSLVRQLPVTDDVLCGAGRCSKMWCFVDSTKCVFDEAKCLSSGGVIGERMLQKARGYCSYCDVTVAVQEQHCSGSNRRLQHKK
jgi:hypothetical protein